MPGVEVTKASELDEDTGQTDGMLRKRAIVDKVDSVCASGIVAASVSCLMPDTTNSITQS